MTRSLDTAHRRRKVVLAGHTGDLDTALGGLSDSDPSIRASALGSLARLGKLLAVQVASASEDPAPAVRARACELAVPSGAPGAPGAWRPTAAAAWLVGGLRDRDATVVEAACFAAGEIGDGLGDGSPQAQTALGAMLEALCEVAGSHPDQLCREAAVAALGAIGDPRGLEVILTAASNDKAAVRRRAVLALAPFDGPEVKQALERAATDRDWQVRQASEDLTSA